ncbi:hypothetical protein H105_04114 [Trichophyton soudanense CBS 452.61]|uniref:Uncharacterized protein n=1 Tax=Trichophyton soudanense CBS 452.61 TaxID=1215331 RepID=A0A022XTV9_TRISD|nr:hypothetical protein H105_04114 [Trichophyton soudanense CBS 452.61]
MAVGRKTKIQRSPADEEERERQQKDSKEREEEEEEEEEEESKGSKEEEEKKQGKGGLLGKRITHRYPQKLAGGEGAAGGILQDVTDGLSDDIEDIKRILEKKRRREEKKSKRDVRERQGRRDLAAVACPGHAMWKRQGCSVGCGWTS